ncbi:MAG TPA: DUF3800 domain-containing protein [Terriglobales bacterium]
MTFCTAYIDDSGTAPDQKIANCTAFIIPAKRILALEKEWKQFKIKEQFCDFHTSEFVARNAKSFFANWDNAKHERVFTRVRQITKKYGVKVWSFSARKDEYDAVVPDEMRRYSGKNHYTWTVLHVLTFLDAWRRFHKTQPIQFIFDWIEKHEECRKEIEETMSYAERESVDRGNAPGLYTNYGFARRADVAGLQCADLLAWTCYRYSLLGFLKTPMSRFAQIAWGDFVPQGTTAGPDDWLTAMVLKKKALEDWVARELASGESLRRFQKWEREDAARKAAKGNT